MALASGFEPRFTTIAHLLLRATAYEVLLLVREDTAEFATDAETTLTGDDAAGEPVRDRVQTWLREAEDRVLDAMRPRYEIPETAVPSVVGKVCEVAMVLMRNRATAGRTGDDREEEKGVEDLIKAIRKGDVGFEGVTLRTRAAVSTGLGTGLTRKFIVDSAGNDPLAGF